MSLGFNTGTVIEGAAELESVEALTDDTHAIIEAMNR